MLKTKTLLFLSLSALLVLAACTRSASTSPVEEPTQDPIESIFSTVATQTALAALNGQGGGEGSTSDAPSDTATPTAELTATPEPTATTTPAPTAEVSVPATYTLHAGEWPYCLARRFDIDPAAIVAANGLGDTTQLSVGTTLTIPAGAASFGGQRALRSHPTTYIASGVDTFYSIACQFGDVWPEHIAEANGKDLDYKPSAGEQLHIP